MNTAEVYPGTDGWRFRVKAANGEILASGEAYVRKIDAESALRALFNGGTTEVVVRNHANEVTDNYALGRAPTLDQIYPGPFEGEPIYANDPPRARRGMHSHSPSEASGDRCCACGGYSDDPLHVGEQMELPFEPPLSPNAIVFEEDDQ